MRACGIKLSCYSLGAPVGRTLRSSRRPPLSDAGLFELEVIGAEESLTTRRGGKLFSYHVSSRTDVNLREGRARERGRDGAERRGLKGEERARSVRAGLRTPPRLLLFPEWPSLLNPPPPSAPQVRITCATSRDKS